MKANWYVSDKKRAKSEGFKKKKYWIASIDSIVDEWGSNQDLKIISLKNHGHKSFDFILYNSNVFTRNPYLKTEDGYKYPVIIDRFQLVLHRTMQEEARENLLPHLFLDDNQNEQKTLKEMFQKINGFNKTLELENWLSAKEMKELLKEMQLIMNDADAYKVFDVLYDL